MSTATALEVDLVNAALLGTDRRALPTSAGPDAAGWLLEAAARRRAETLVVAASRRVALPAPAPAETRAAPSLEARAVLDEILLGSANAVVNLWLGEALDAGTHLAPEHWTPVLERARRATDLDRVRLGRALGAAGLWFARHNPAWSAVVRTAAAATPTAGGSGSEILSEGRSREAVATLAAGTHALGAARELGWRAGERLALTAYARVAEAGSAAASEPARVALAVAEEVLWVRWGLAQAFDPGREPPERRPAPPAPVPRATSTSEVHR